VFAGSAAAVQILTATALADASGRFTDAGAITHAISAQLRSRAAAAFAIVLLNGSLLCAAAPSLFGSYTIAEVFGRKPL
jgi:hypothetical protein